MSLLCVSREAAGMGGITVSVKHLFYNKKEQIFWFATPGEAARDGGWIKWKEGDIAYEEEKSDEDEDE